VARIDRDGRRDGRPQRLEGHPDRQIAALSYRRAEGGAVTVPDLGHWVADRGMFHRHTVLVDSSTGESLGLLDLGCQYQSSRIGCRLMQGVHIGDAGDVAVGGCGLLGGGPRGDAVFLLAMSSTDLQRMRFAYSPLAEVTESLHMLSCGQVPDLYRGWSETIRGKLSRVDMRLLRVVVPPGPDVPRFMFLGTADAGTTIQRQLQLVADYPADQLGQDLREIWGGNGLPAAAEILLSDGGGRLAEALWQYWQIAIEPHWTQIRALLDADVAYRAARLANGGIECLLADLHPRIKLHDHVIHAGTAGPVTKHDLSGTGLLLIPCAFAWPYLEVGVGNPWPPHLIYAARGIGNLWRDRQCVQHDHPDVLGELLGRSRAAILTSVALPMSTTCLARELSLSPPAVSAHLSVLRRGGLVSSSRSGRRVLYQRTLLGSSIIAASSADSRQAV
jgi:DNA-binding transcriptional ArsR family regulator